MTALAKAVVADAPASRWRSVSRSHVGSVRSINEDRVFDCPERSLWAVVDGMGGHRGGDLAAQAVVDRLRALSLTSGPIDQPALLGALIDANRHILARNAQLALDSGATVVAVAIERDAVRIAWAGDSRAYLLRDGAVTQLTHDHSLVQELIDAGLLTPEAAERHPQANVVTRALGVDDRLDIATVALDALPDDRIVLCSDGLSRSLHDGDLSSAGTIEQVIDRLLGNALQRDGSDNISLVVLDCAALD